MGFLFGNMQDDRVTIEKTIKEIANSSYRYSTAMNNYDFSEYKRRFDNEEVLSNVIKAIARKDWDFSVHINFITFMYESICINKSKMEERTTFERFLDLYLENPEIFIKNDNFKKVINSFSKKDVALEYLRFLLTNGNILENTSLDNLSKLIDYVCQARQYYVNDREFISAAMNVVTDFDSALLKYGDQDVIEEIIKKKLSEDKKASGIYDFDQSTIAELDTKVGENILQLNAVIRLAQQHIDTLKELSNSSKSEITRLKVKVLGEIESKISSFSQNFDEAYKMLLNQERDSLFSDRDAITSELRSIVNQAKTDLQTLASSLSKIAKIEVDRITDTGNMAQAKVQDIVDNNEELQKILSKHQDSNSLLNVLEQLGNLGPENLSRLLGVSTAQAGTLPAGVIPTGSSVVVAPEIIMHKPEEPVDLTINYYFDQTIPFKQRFDQVMELKRKDIAENGTVYHERFDEAVVYFLLGKVPYLCGESGVGKSRLAQQMCDLLDLKMHINGFIEFPQDLLGYTNAADGAYVPSNFYRCYKYGYTIFLDELDNGQPKGTVTLGRFIDPDNKEYMFPDGKITRRHPNFRIITSGNTKGSGKTQKYNAREKIDEAIMSRLKVVEMYYDNKIGKTILKDYPDWYNFGINFAEAVSKCGNVGGSFSAREADSLRTDLDTGCLSTQAIMEATFIKTKDPDLLQRIIARMEEQLGNGSFTQGGKKLLSTFTNVVNSRGNQLCKRR